MKKHNLVEELKQSQIDFAKHYRDDFVEIYGFGIDAYLKLSDDEIIRKSLTLPEDISEDELNSIIEDSNDVDDFLEKMEKRIENKNIIKKKK